MGRLGLEPRTGGLKVRSSTIELTPLVVQGHWPAGLLRLTAARAERALESDNKAPKTIRPYVASVRSLAAFLRANDMPGDAKDVGHRQRLHRVPPWDMLTCYDLR